MSFDPYLHFRGDCAAAMEFYANVFAADDLFMMRYSEMPEAPPVFADSDRVLHATLTLGGRMLMASDFPPGTESWSPKSGYYATLDPRCEKDGLSGWEAETV